MPYDDPDTTDPMMLHGVVVETQGDTAMRDMAECFIEEYIRSGFDRDRIFKMFQTRGYAGPYLAYQALGEDEIRKMIDELFPLWGERRSAPTSASPVDANISLPVLES